jgi:hypothetical protein
MGRFISKTPGNIFDLRGSAIADGQQRGREERLTLGCWREPSMILGSASDGQPNGSVLKGILRVAVRAHSRPDQAFESRFDQSGLS